MLLFLLLSLAVREGKCAELDLLVAAGVTGRMVATFLFFLGEEAACLPVPAAAGGAKGLSTHGIGG